MMNEVDAILDDYNANTLREMAEAAAQDNQTLRHGYPHFYYLDDKPRSRRGQVASGTGRSIMPQR
jgi:glycine hydroxymethyltransferase